MAIKKTFPVNNNDLMRQQQMQDTYSSPNSGPTERNMAGEEDKELGSENYVEGIQSQPTPSDNRLDEFGNTRNINQQESQREKPPIEDQNFSIGEQTENRFGNGNVEEGRNEIRGEEIGTSNLETSKTGSKQGGAPINRSINSELNPNLAGPFERLEKTDLR